MTATALSYEDANAVWDVLVELAGAHEDDRDAFTRYLTTPDRFGHEYRFIGLLGFGGKLHYSGHRAPRVSCYPEHRNEEREAIIAAVNERLQAHRPGHESEGA